MGLLQQPLAGPGYVILNVIRGMNIICLLAIIAASAVMLVKTNIFTNFFFFDATMHVVIACISMLLIVSEMNVFRWYFDRNWPLLGRDSGFVTFGITVIILGISTMGNLNQEATDKQSLGLAFWRVVIAAGIIAIIVGFINIVASFVFRDPKLGVTARHVRARGAVAAHEAATGTSSFKSFHLSRKDSLPSYRSSTSIPRSASMRQAQRLPIKISTPITNSPDQVPRSPVSPVSPNVTVPNLAHHPAMYSNRI